MIYQVNIPPEEFSALIVTYFVSPASAVNKLSHNSIHPGFNTVKRTVYNDFLDQTYSHIYRIFKYIIRRNKYDGI